MNSSPSRPTYRVTARNVAAVTAVATVFVWVVVCFCSLLPILLLMSLLFNTLVLGPGLFSALAQEREKRTIDALRLTQLSSLDILRYKAVGEFRAWKSVNAILMLLIVAAALWTSSPVGWAVAGAVALASGGLLSMALALAVSTRCETTSSAVVTGWISKGVWLVGLPILDYVLEAVLVLGRDLNLFSYLDPAWVYKAVVSALIFETGFSSLLATLMGAVASVVVAGVLLWRSSKVIDQSFEATVTLEDRARHEVYGRSFPLGLQNNPFMVRELAWQVRTGAGSWPGYAVFLTLFVAPFLYGVAQQHKVQERQPVKVVRQSVTSQTSPLPVAAPAGVVQKSSGGIAAGGCVTPEPRYHGLICVSQMMGLPVPSRHRSDYQSLRDGQALSTRLVLHENGKVRRVTDAEVEALEAPKAGAEVRKVHRTLTRTHLQNELDRGLLTGLILTLLYLFIRGGAFMSGAVTGEKERRAWDQIALTGATPESYLSGKLIGVLYYPMRQLLFTSPVLLLFAAFGGISLVEIVLMVPLLLASFFAAGCLGLMSSTTEPTSHQAQGKVLLAAAAVLLIPLLPLGWFFAALLVFSLLGRSGVSGSERLLAAIASGCWVGTLGAYATPLVAVTEACHWHLYGGFRFGSNGLPASLVMLSATATMLAVAWSAYRFSVRSLDQGGSVKAC